MQADNNILTKNPESYQSLRDFFIRESIYKIFSSCFACVFATTLTVPAPW